MPNPWIIVCVLVLWIASATGIGYWQNSAGHTAERVKWEAQQADDLVHYNAMIQAKEEAYRLEEQQHAADLSMISSNYQKELDDAKTKTDDLVRAARAGSLRLRDPGAHRCSSGRDHATKTSAAASRRDGSSDGGLSADATEFLLGLTGRCNQVRNKLTSCQAIVRSDRAIYEDMPAH